MADDTMTTHINTADSRMQRIVSSCPSLSVPYEAPWWCFNCWINVVAMKHKEKASLASCPNLSRDTILRPDGGEVSVDWYPSGNLPVDAPMLGILHTITGGSPQQAGFMHYATSRGWRCCVLNRRGHSGMPLRVPFFSLLGNTDDTVAMVDFVKATHPNSFIALAGLSAGSGVVINYIGREGNAAACDAAASLCPAWDISKSFDHLQQRYSFMDRYILKGCKEFFLREPQSQEALALMPVAVEQALRATTMNEFMVAAVPLAGCETMDEFHQQNNPLAFMFGNKTPCLVLNALDDFLCVEENIKVDLVQTAMNYVLIVTDTGSHVAYTESSSECGNYMWRITMDFFEAVRADNSRKSAHTPAPLGLPFPLASGC